MDLQAMTTRRSFIVASITTLCADLASKVVAVAMLSGGAVDLGLLNLRLVRNEGVAFGMAAAVGPAVLVLVTSLAVLALVVGVWRGAIPAGVPAGLIVGGASANVLDRLTEGSVIDMLDLGWWPAFNLADIFIVGGAVLLLLTTGRSDSRI